VEVHVDALVHEQQHPEGRHEVHRPEKGQSIITKSQGKVLEEQYPDGRNEVHRAEKGREMQHESQEKVHKPSRAVALSRDENNTPHADGDTLRKKSNMYEMLLSLARRMCRRDGGAELNKDFLWILTKLAFGRASEVHSRGGKSNGRGLCPFPLLNALMPRDEAKEKSSRCAEEDAHREGSWGRGWRIHRRAARTARYSKPKSSRVNMPTFWACMYDSAVGFRAPPNSLAISSRPQSRVGKVACGGAVLRVFGKKCAKRSARGGMYPWLPRRNSFLGRGA